MFTVPCILSGKLSLLFVFFLDAGLEFVVLRQGLEPTGLEFTEVLALRLSAAIKGIFIFYIQSCFRVFL